MIPTLQKQYDKVEFDEELLEACKKSETIAVKHRKQRERMKYLKSFWG